jgi:arylsulfatase A-like enzyme
MRWLTVLPAITVLAVFGCTPPRSEVDVDFHSDFELLELEFEKAHFNLGTGEGRGHLGFGWSMPEQPRPDQSFVWAMGAESEVTFFLSAPRRLELGLVGRPFVFPGCPVQEVEVALNGSVVGRVEVPRQRQRLRLPLPVEATRAGTNRLRLSYAYHRRPSDVVESGDVRSLAVAWELVDLVGCRPDEPPHRDPEVQGVVVLPPSTAVAVTLAPGGPRRLMIDELQGWEGEVCATWEVDGNEIQSLGCWAADGGSVVQRLPAHRQEPARLKLVASAAPADLQLVGARVVGRSDPQPRRTGPDPAAARTATSVVLYVVDTLRADRLGCYGYHRSTSPRLDRLAEHGIVFENVVAESSWTKPTVTSLLSGLGGLEHGVVDRNHKVVDDLPWLAAMLADAGYRTAAFTANAYLTRHAGYARGFDTFEFEPEDASTTTRKAIAWLETSPEDRPFLLWVHTVDPHAPYQPRERFRQEFAPAVEDRRIGTVDFLRRFGSREFPKTTENYDHLNNLYDAEVAQNDEAFGELLDALERRGRTATTLIVFVSDHGESLGERGVVGHGLNLYDETVKVPLVVHPPGGTDTRRSGTMVTQTDLVPTVLDVVGLPAPRELPGRSLKPLWDQADSGWADRTAVTFLHTEGRHGLGVRRGRWKAIEPLGTGFSHGRELYDVADDPAEQHDVIDQRPVMAAWLISIGRRAILDAPQPVDIERGPSKMERDALRALGYLQ